MKNFASTFARLSSVSRVLNQGEAAWYCDECHYYFTDEDRTGSGCPNCHAWADLHELDRTDIKEVDDEIDDLIDENDRELEKILVKDKGHTIADLK